MRGCRVLGCVAKYASPNQGRAAVSSRVLDQLARSSARSRLRLRPNGMAQPQCTRNSAITDKNTGVTRKSYYSSNTSPFRVANASKHKEAGKDLEVDAQSSGDDASPAQVPNALQKNTNPAGVQTRDQPTVYHGFTDPLTGSPMPLTFTQEDAALAAASRQIRRIPDPLPKKTFSVENAFSPAERFRTVMRRVAHSVVVCTTIEPPDGKGKEAQPRGMTMSSLTSLSMHPTPAVTFNIAAPSRTLDALQASRVFNIHVLAGTREGAAVAHRFTKGNSEQFSPFAHLGSIGVQRLPPEALDGRGSTYEPPVLLGAGVSYVLRCKLMDDEPHRGLVRVRDHVIILGDVLEATIGMAGEDTAARQGENIGLLYGNQRYRRIGPRLMEGRKSR
jgi:flavin reductase (DIM6/NTAB) family NADH-FMN oxidoreductase RutF